MIIMLRACHTSPPAALHTFSIFNLGVCHNIRTCIHIYTCIIHTYIHTYIYTYRHTDIHTYIPRTSLCGKAPKLNAKIEPGRGYEDILIAMFYAKSYIGRGYEAEAILIPTHIFPFRVARAVRVTFYRQFPLYTIIKSIKSQRG